MIYLFETDCTTSDARSIRQMVDQAKKITYRTFIKNVAIDHLRTIYPFNTYEWGSGDKPGLRLKDDWHVRYYRSVYRGIPCYYIDHSAIEYVFTLKGTLRR